MSSLETLRTELDMVCVEKQQLKATKVHLQEQIHINSQGKDEGLDMKAIKLTEECTKLRRLYEGVLWEMQRNKRK